jgi:hypothetical protein
MAWRGDIGRPSNFFCDFFFSGAGHLTGRAASPAWSSLAKTFG